MSKLVVTTGKRYADIDGLACVVAYAEIPVERPLAVIDGPLNNSVTNIIRSWKMNYLIKLEPSDYRFVIVDVSEEKEFPLFVTKDRVVEIYDHHFGFEKDWSYLGDKCKIEPVGACATLIWEAFKKTKLPLITDNQLLITPLSANLLFTAIVSNTLNFQASVTADRDKKAFEELKTFTCLPDNWIAQYYQDQEVSVYTDPASAVANDTKFQIIKGMKCAVGQVELWNSKDFLKDHQNTIEIVLREFNPECWFFISPSITEARTYIFTRNESIKDLLRSVMEIDFFGTDVGVTKKLWLRKEILKLFH